MPMNPVLAWSRLAWDSGAMALDAAQVIAFRTSRAADHAEVRAMSREKGEAALDAMHAMGLPLMRMYQLMAALGFSQMLSLCSAMLAVGSNRLPARTLQRQLKLAGDAMSSSAAGASRIAGSGAVVARSALNPVRRKVKANVTRLRKKRKS